jgi:hypothetical protein
VDEVTHAVRHHDGLIGGDLSKTSAIQVVKMGMGDEDEVDVGQMVMRQAGVPQATDDEEPVGPVGIDENVSMGPLNQERCVPDPGEANLTGFQSGKDGGSSIAMTSFS